MRNRKCKFVHGEPRTIIGARCVHCASLYRVSRTEIDRAREASRTERLRDVRKIRDAERYYVDVEASRSKGRETQRKRAEKAALYSSNYHIANRDKITQRHAHSRRADPATHRARVMAREAAKIQATPPWADKKAIAAVYRECLEIQIKTGIPHHVDHIVPLRGKIVSGLHVHWNLRVITATENVRKHAKLIPELAMAA
jgi:5-methylcytosine-specific restriction endonuclease McrA